MTAPTSGPHGVLVVDKPRGPTSHDLVAWARRALGTRSVGHAGTLDPLASGVLVLLVGEATKLSPFLSADDKRYETTIVLGRETDTLDAAGTTTAEAAVPPHLDVRRALESFLGETMQLAPIVSALKKDGVSLHTRARRGESVDPPTRAVLLHSFSVLSTTPTTISVQLHVGKGFYVRSLARDLALALGTRGHVGELRRTASGAFGLDGALPAETLRNAAHGDEEAKKVVLAALLAVPVAAARAMPVVAIDETTVADARAGRVVALTLPAPPPPHVALVDASGELVAVAAPSEDGWRVVRGFAATLRA